jgi:hypothetical protein
VNRSGIRHSSVRTAAAAASVLVSVVALTGCGGDSDSADPAAKTSSSATAGQGSDASGAKPLTAAELDKAALTAADADGYRVSTPKTAETTAAEKTKVTGEECEPLGRVMAGTAVSGSDATVYRRVTGTATSKAAALDLNTGMITLASYPSADEAAAALKSVGDAVATCAGGFGWAVGGEKLSAGKVTKDTAPKAGEEAVAFTAVTEVEGVGAPYKAVVFRDGATLAHLVVANTASLVSGKDFTFPADLVTAQAGKLA